MTGNVVGCINAPSSFPSPFVPFATSLAILPTKKAQSISSLDSALGHVTYYGFWHMRGHEETKDLKSDCMSDLALSASA